LLLGPLQQYPQGLVDVPVQQRECLRRLRRREAVRNQGLDPDAPFLDEGSGPRSQGAEGLIQAIATDQQLALRLAGVKGEGLAVIEPDQVHRAVRLDHLQGALEGLHSRWATDAVHHDIRTPPPGQGPHLGHGVHLATVDGRIRPEGPRQAHP
jgi:hypothetical protein